jgi:hypothetical protein
LQLSFKHLILQLLPVRPPLQVTAVFLSITGETEAGQPVCPVQGQAQRGTVYTGVGAAVLGNSFYDELFLGRGKPGSLQNRSGKSGAVKGMIPFAPVLPPATDIVKQAGAVGDLFGKMAALFFKQEQVSQPGNREQVLQIVAAKGALLFGNLVFLKIEAIVAVVKDSVYPVHISSFRY